MVTGVVTALQGQSDDLELVVTRIPISMEILVQTTTISERLRQNAMLPSKFQSSTTLDASMLHRFSGLCLPVRLSVRRYILISQNVVLLVFRRSK